MFKGEKVINFLAIAAVTIVVSCIISIQVNEKYNLRSKLDSMTQEKEEMVNTIQDLESVIEDMRKKKR